MSITAFIGVCLKQLVILRSIFVIRGCISQKAQLYLSEDVFKSPFEFVSKSSKTIRRTLCLKLLYKDKFLINIGVAKNPCHYLNVSHKKTFPFF